MAELVWWPMRGYGKHEIDPEAKVDVYNASYFENFERISECARGRALNGARARFVRQYWNMDVIDIGIGSGAFMRCWEANCGSTAFGYDVAQRVVLSLQDKNRFVDPRMLEGVPGNRCLTMWDSIEHMEDPGEILRSGYEWIFLSTPIYDGAEHCIKSHHYKPGEHIWYFTERGLIGYMLDHDYEMVQRSRLEEDFGRKDIGTYAFRRKDA